MVMAYGQDNTKGCLQKLQICYHRCN